jgi:hypothetical protein
MESKSRRTPRIAAAVENRASAAMRPTTKPAASEPPAAPQPAVSGLGPDSVPPAASAVSESLVAATAAASDVTNAAPAAPPTLRVTPPPAIAGETPDDMFAAIAQSRAVLAQGLDAIGNEFANFARHSLDASAQAAIQMLEAKTWADAFAVNSGLAQIGLDCWLGSTAKVSEIGIRLAIDWSKPLASELEKVWGGPAFVR